MKRISIIVLLILYTEGFAFDSLIIKVKKEQSIRLLKRYETFQSRPYKLGGYWFIGYGHLTKDSISIITEEKADSLLRLDFKRNLVHFKQNKPADRAFLLALLSFNIGVGKVLKSPLYLNNLSNEEFVNKYKRYCYFKGKFHNGIYRRRLAELNIWIDESKLDKQERTCKKEKH